MLRLSSDVKLLGINLIDQLLITSNVFFRFLFWPKWFFHFSLNESELNAAGHAGLKNGKLASPPFRENIFASD